MFKQDSKFVKHIFWDPEMKTCYSLYVTIENQQKIQNDKVFALKTFQQAKSVFLQNEAAKLKKETNLQSKQDEQENSSTNDVNKKRIKKENDDPDEADDNNATNKKLKKETTPIKGEVISDNEVDDEKLNENKIIEMLDNDDDVGDDNNDNKNKNNDDESSNKVTKKKVKEEINVPEFVNVQQDESIIPDNNDEWHDASSQQEDNTVNNFEDVSDDNNAKKTNTASRRLTRNRKISNQKPVQRPRRLVTMEKPKIEQFSWNHNDIKFLIKSYERHQELLKNQVKNRFFWTNIVKDMNKKNIKVDKDTCQAKWSSLLKTYNKCKAKLIFPTNFPFYQMMEQVLGQPKSPKKIEKTTEEELNVKKIGLLNVENDSNVCNKKLIIDSKINNSKSPRVLLLSTPINEQTKLSSLSSTVQINNNTNNANNTNTNTRRISQGSQNFTLEDVERVVQNALDTKLQRIVNAFESTIESLKSMSNSLNIKVTNNEETVTQIKNKVQNLENEFKSATVKLVKDNNNTDTTKTMQTVMLNNQQGTPEQLNKKKKLFIISRPKAIIDSSGKKKVYQQVQDVQSIEGNISTSKLKKICRLQSTPGKSTETSIDNVNNKNKTSTTPTTPTSTQRQMTVIGQFLKLSKFPTAQSTPIGNVIKISDPASARNSSSSIINKVE